MLRRAQRAGERHHVIVIAEGLLRWIGGDPGRAVRRREELGGGLEMAQVMRHIEQIAIESNEIIKNSIGVIKMS